MKALLELIKKLYGSKALSKTIGTRTNVITLPDKDTKRFITNELNVDAASDAAVKKAFEDVEKLIPEIPKLNDQEILTFTGNLRRLDQRLNPPSAEVIEFGTKQPVSPAGIKQLAAEKGLPEDVDPNSPLGRIMQRVNKIRIEGKDLAKEFGMEDQLKKGLDDLMKKPSAQFEDMLKDPTRSGGPLDPKVGIVRTAAREILEKNLKAGKIDIPDAAEKDAILKSYQGGVDPIDVLRKRYGEGILEELDDIADDLNKATDYNQITKMLDEKGLLNKKPKKEYGYDEGVMSDEEMSKFLKESEEPEEFAAGGRVGYAYGSGLKLIKLLKDKGKTLTKAIQEAVDNIMPTGDKKLDADMAVDDMFENLGIDRDAVDQKDVLDAYDQAYQLIAKPSPDVPAATTTAKIEGLKSLGLDPSDFPDIPDDAISFASPKSQIAQPMSKEMIVSKYGDMIDDELMAKILTDDDPQRIAEVLATIDEAMTMQNKGMGSEEIISTIKKTPRTKQAGGGLAYLMGL